MSLLNKTRLRAELYAVKIMGSLAALFLKPRIKYLSGAESEFSPVFIIGAPRTGSTVLYQALTNVFNVAYVDNLAASFYKNLPLGAWFSGVFFGDRPHNNYKASFGNTQNYGWHAPSECGQFWYRWLPIENHFVDRGDISQSNIQEMQSEVRKAQCVAGKPLLFKNLNAGQRLRVLSEAFPNARIIYLKRDPRFTAASILRARQENKVSPDQWWSIRPKNFRALLELEEKAMAVGQVYYLERQIEKDLGLFNPNNIRVVHYNELSEDKVNSLGDWLGLLKREGGAMPDFFQDSPEKLGLVQYKQLTRLAKKYPFPKDAFI